MNTIHPIRTLAAILTLCLTSGSSLQADIIIDVKDAVIPVGGSGFVNVIVRASPGMSHNIAVFDASFDIQNIGTPVGALHFSGPHLVAPNNSQSDSELIDNDYLFFDDSSNALFGFAPTVDPDGQGMTQGDTVENFGVDDPSTSVLLEDTDQLLARLEIFHDVTGPAAAAATDSFLVNPDFTDLFAFYGDDGFTEFTINESLSSGGTITFSSSAAVPEPSTWAMLVLLTGVTAHRFRRRSSDA